MTKEQLNELRRAYRTAKDGAERTWYQAVWLYGQGDPVADICRITGCSTTSLMEWNRQYREQGPEGLADQRDGRNRARLTPEQTDALSDKLRLYTPRDLFGPETYTASGQHWTVEDLARAVQQWYGVRWQSRTSYHTLFARCAFSYQRTEKVVFDNGIGFSRRLMLLANLRRIDFREKWSILEPSRTLYTQEKENVTTEARN